MYLISMITQAQELDEKNNSPLPGCRRSVTTDVKIPGQPMYVPSDLFLETKFDTIGKDLTFGYRSGIKNTSNE